MQAREILVEGFSRIGPAAHAVLDGLSDEQLTFAPTPQANTIAWLIWHLTRVQDDHVSDLPLAGHSREQIWHSGGWAGRFALPFDDSATGYGQSVDEVHQVRPTVKLLADYYDATYAATQEFLGAITDSDLDIVVDTNWDPPVTMGVRLVSVIDDSLQHLGQAAYLRGLL